MSTPGPMGGKPGPIGGKPGPGGMKPMPGATKPGPMNPGPMTPGPRVGSMPGGGATRPMPKAQSGIPGKPGGAPGNPVGAPGQPGSVKGPKVARGNFDHSATEKPTSKLAISSVAVGVFAPVVGIVLGIMAKIKLKKNENIKGKKLATVGIVASIVSLLLQGAFGYYVYSEVTKLNEYTVATATKEEAPREEVSVRLGYCTDLRDTLTKLTSEDQKEVVRGMLIMAESDSKNSEVYQQAYDATQDNEKTYDAASLKSALTEDIRACG